jgi:hypothetical protein
MVVFKTSDGKPGYHQADSLDEAVRFVERLRNTEDVPDVHIYRMQEVPIEFRVYYRVELTEVPEPMSPPGPAIPIGDQSGPWPPEASAAGSFGAPS